MIVANQEPQSMASAKAFKEVNAVGIRNIIEFLTRLDNETGEVKGQLALSWEQVSPTSMHFKLREGVKFHDGTPMDAEAVYLRMITTGHGQGNTDNAAEFSYRVHEIHLDGEMEFLHDFWMMFEPFWNNLGPTWTRF